MTFNGFLGGTARLTFLPEQFFEDVLPLVNDVAELKVVLFTAWALQRRTSHPYLTWEDYHTHELLTQALLPLVAERSLEAVLQDALEGALTHNILLGVRSPFQPQKILYLMNSERGQEVAGDILNGMLNPFADEGGELLPPRPNIYRLYEQEIGLLTPMVGEALQDLEDHYPLAWIESAIRIASEQQARNLKYIRAILERWRIQGRNDETTRRGTEQHHEQRYIHGEDASFIQH
ncbi:MAG: DnaD domain-containing protein [Phototrophicaceae bacterium]